MVLCNLCSNPHDEMQWCGMCGVPYCPDCGNDFSCNDCVAAEAGGFG